ncbi:Restriction endonuclease [Micromonospora echinospora]|uniref:Restriction endonuclease n=2 Tax=Micromonospora echinospora TaxID=1877 RepID=A0A1C4WGW6_MICEC|nr:Restriction endonuclease [Micromonospora echinospora]
MVERGQRVLMGAACSPIKLHVQIETDDLWHAAYFCRAESFWWPGDRTDLNDMYSTVLQAALWKAGLFGLATSQVPHPAKQLPGEIWGRWLFPRQPEGPGFSGRENAIRLVVGLRVVEDVLHDLLGCALPQEEDDHRTFEFDADALTSWANDVAYELFDRRDLAEDDYIGSRSSADYSWRHYRSTLNGASVFRCPAIAEKAKTALAIARPIQETPVPGGTLIDYQPLRSYKPGRLQTRAIRLLRRLENHRSGTPLVLPLDDCLFVVGDEHLLFLPTDGGTTRYGRERERVLRWHREQAVRLFGPEEFEWDEPINAGRFEELVRDLLIREPGVDPQRVRSMGPTTERDGGRDLVLEWMRPAMGRALEPDSERPFIRRNFIVQCKAKMKTVGVSDVHDLLTTMYHHRADGFMLVVSRRISGSLLNRLEDIRRRGDFDAEWWTRVELEDRLRQHPDLVARYRDIVRRVEN